MTAVKPKIDPAKLKPTSGRDRMTIEHPVRVVKKPTGSGVAAKFNPNQLRDPGGEGGGQWTVSPTGAIKDALKLAGKIDLASGEKLVGSEKVASDLGTVRMALVEHGDIRSLRLGIGGSGFGSRDDEAGPWRAGLDRTAAINAERKKLRDEEESLHAEWDRTTDPARKAAIDKRLAELDDMDKGEVYPSGYTANLDEANAGRLGSALSDGVDAADKQFAVENALYDEIDRLEAERKPFRGMPRKWTAAEEAKWDDLTAQIERVNAEIKQSIGKAIDAHGGDKKDNYIIFAEGSIPGQWADVHYRVELDDRGVGVHVYLGAVPHDVPDVHNLNDLGDHEQDAVLDIPEARKLLRLLAKFTAGTGGDAAVRAAGHDTTPGHDELHHYWTVGAGRRKWVDSPEPWTTLVALLTPHVGPEKAKVFASRWFFEVKGYYSGSDKNRVAHGHPPRGHRVGPG